MRVGIVGGGIVGLAVARQVATARPGAQVVLFEKEQAVAAHQSGHNSGVLHAGVYYTPGSDKAVLCTRGRQLMVRFCEDNDVAVRNSGKLIVARDAAEERRLGDLLDRARANQVPGARLLGPEEMREVEPHIEGVRALHSPETGVVDFAAVTRRLSDVASGLGVEVRVGAPVERVVPRGDVTRIITTEQTWTFDAVVVCGGLQSDRLARSAGMDPSPAIVPFRGAYLRLSPQHAARVRSLVYPVPDPRYPFLGVHLTRTIRQDVLAGPNALLALAREGYRYLDIDGRDVREMLRWPGFWRMAARNWPAGLRELVLAVARPLYARQVSTYLPGVTGKDLQPAGSGVRAQAVTRSGALVDDFVIDRQDSVVVVRNAPSPAATSSLAIAERIVSVLFDEQVEAPEAA